MRHLFDLENWPRKDHFNFFNRFEEPFFGVVVDIDCTIAYDKCKREGKGFFLYYLHQALAAANSIENFRLRIEDDQIYLYDKVHASAVINRPDGTFGFSYIDSMGSVKNVPEMKAYYLRKTEGEGKQKMLVLNAIRNKLILRIFACVNQDRSYQTVYLRSPTNEINNSR